MNKAASNAASNRARPVYTDPPGAPFKIGQAVFVRQLADEEADKASLGRRGTVVHFEYSCGCGQSYPSDPMIGVRFADGSIHEFWREELQRLKPRFNRTPGGMAEAMP